MMWYGMVWCGVVWYDVVWYGVVWYGVVGCTFQHDASGFALRYVLAAAG